MAIVNYVHTPKKITWSKSVTIPDQNYTVKELFERFARGLPVQASRQQPIFLGEENTVDLEKVHKMSIMDKADLSAEMAERAKSIKQQLIDDEEKRSAEEEEKEAADKIARQAKSGTEGDGKA